MLFHVLLALAAVMLTGRLLGRLFAYLRQPPVIGEVVAGIALGPSLLGWLWPDAAAFLLPDAATPYLGVLAQFGIVLYMFVVGLELNGDLLRQRALVTVAVSHAGIVVPFALGCLLAVPLYPHLAGPDVSPVGFALFFGVAMAVTAFPVLARILADRGLTRTDLGVTALTCAATGDATAWCLLAVVVGVVQARVGAGLAVAGLTLLYVAVMVLVVRPLAVRLAGRSDAPPSREVLAGVLAAMLVSAVIAEAIGIHALFGAFLLGAVIPHDSAVARYFTDKLEDLVTVLLLPAFFAFTGMRTQFGLLGEPAAWAVCGLIILVATVGKVGGTLIAARLTGQGWRSAAALGVLMNTRGLMELVVLNVGLDLGVIAAPLFAMMVLMALVTTVATAPLLNLFGPYRFATLPGQNYKIAE